MIVITALYTKIDGFNREIVFSNLLAEFQLQIILWDDSLSNKK
jgi:hypothetical protein